VPLFLKSNADFPVDCPKQKTKYLMDIDEDIYCGFCSADGEKLPAV